MKNSKLSVLKPDSFIGDITKEDTKSPIPDAVWYVAEKYGQGLMYTFPKGSLAKAKYIYSDMLLDGKYISGFKITLKDEENKAEFFLFFGLLPQCSAKMRVTLDAVNQNNWRYKREGGFLKPECYGKRLDLKNVDHMSITIQHKSPSYPVRWCMTPVISTNIEPEYIKDPILPKGALLDEFGQSTLLDWPGKSRSEEEITERIKSQYKESSSKKWPDIYSKWGGWKKKRVIGTGFFNLYKDEKRWWLVDPDGYLFWSAGLDIVKPRVLTALKDMEKACKWIPEEDGIYKECFTESKFLEETKIVDYLKVNFIRTFGPEKWYDKWKEIAVGLLKDFGFNSFGNWSDWKVASDEQIPYVRHMWMPTFKTIFRDFPDVFRNDFKEYAENFARQLEDTANDPAFIGYFMMNEPKWGFANICPALGMLYNTDTCETRKAMANFFKKRYKDNSAFASAWNMDVTFNNIIEGVWDRAVTQEAIKDLEDFSAVMADLFFTTLSDACKKVDKNHLNLGIRYNKVPPAWAVKGMKNFDVFSMNSYSKPRLSADKLQKVYEMLNMPIIIGEWHYGALDVGLPASGIGHVPDQESRGKSYRIFLEDAAAKPWCIGVQYFLMYDQSAIGRADGECYNIGFLDVCNRPYKPLADAARACHEIMYNVVNGDVEPYNDEPEYLPLLSI